MKQIINITNNAWKKLNNITKKSNTNIGFLFGVTSGGCNGFNFDLKLLNNQELQKIKNKKPNILKNNDVSVYVDPTSEIYLIGTTIDYIHEDYSKNIYESKFIYSIDKELASSCGCGISFMPKNI
mgnify:FL=1|jgi:iron-sulfur cluster assembly protein|tara:strand:- start:231 stop:605 length:375 start_codon:yes stop_codon:yes gene_type:complete